MKNRYRNQTTAPSTRPLVLLLVSAFTLAQVPAALAGKAPPQAPICTDPTYQKLILNLQTSISRTTNNLASADAELESLKKAIEHDQKLATAQRTSMIIASAAATGAFIGMFAAGASAYAAIHAGGTGSAVLAAGVPIGGIGAILTSGRALDYVYDSAFELRRLVELKAAQLAFQMPKAITRAKVNGYLDVDLRTLPGEVTRQLNRYLKMSGIADRVYMTNLGDRKENFLTQIGNGITEASDASQRVVAVAQIQSEELFFSLATLPIAVIGCQKVSLKN